jgi:hypothetical protein
MESHSVCSFGFFHSVVILGFIHVHCIANSLIFIKPLSLKVQLTYHKLHTVQVYDFLFIVNFRTVQLSP